MFFGNGDTEYPNYIGNNVSTVIVNAAAGTSSQTLTGTGIIRVSANWGTTNKIGV